MMWVQARAGTQCAGKGMEGVQPKDSLLAGCATLPWRSACPGLGATTRSGWWADWDGPALPAHGDGELDLGGLEVSYDTCS